MPGDHVVQHPGSKQGQLEWVAKGYVFLSFEYLQEWKLHSVSGQPESVCHRSKEKGFFHEYKQNFLNFSLCPLHLVPGHC